jgi:phage portal protein BeeE
MGVIDTVNKWLRRYAAVPPPLPGVDNLWPYASIGGYSYPLAGLTQTMPGAKQEEIEQSFEGYVQRVYKTNGIIFACMAAHLHLFTQARFQWQRMNGGVPGDLFGTDALSILEHPWQNAVTADLLARASQDADAAGNFYAARRGNRIKRMRPDWVTIVLGSESNPDVTSVDLDADVLGYIYHPGGKYSGNKPVPLLATEVAHYAPIPDPLANFRGMSWLTSIIREVMGDNAATTHKLMFFENGATANLVVKRTDSLAKSAFDDWVAMVKSGHTGLANAYKTFFLDSGADATVIGANMQQMEFKVTQGAGEVRIAAAASVHPVILGISEGLSGSSLNSGNFEAARRLYADMWARPSWANLAASLETIAPPPRGARLWYDDRNISFLAADQKDAADIEQIKSQTIRTLIEAGFKADDVIKAVEAADMGLLSGKHTGLFSVQLQAPGSTKMPAGEVPGEGPVGPGSGPETIPAGDTSTKPVTGGGKAPPATKKPPAKPAA